MPSRRAPRELPTRARRRRGRRGRSEPSRSPRGSAPARDLLWRAVPLMIILSASSTKSTIPRKRRNSRKTKKCTRRFAHPDPRVPFGCRIRASYLSRKTSSTDVHVRRATMRVPRQVRVASPPCFSSGCPARRFAIALLPATKYPTSSDSTERTVILAGPGAHPSRAVPRAPSAPHPKRRAPETADDTWSPSVARAPAISRPTRFPADPNPSAARSCVSASRSLQNATEQLFRARGRLVKVKDRNYFPTVEDDDLILVLFRLQEISRYVADGVLDAGTTGADWIVENWTQSSVTELKYSKATANPARWVIAVPEDEPVRDVKDLEGTLIASELSTPPRSSSSARRARRQGGEYSWGARRR